MIIKNNLKTEDFFFEISAPEFSNRVLNSAFEIDNGIEFCGTYENLNQEKKEFCWMFTKTEVESCNDNDFSNLDFTSKNIYTEKWL